MGHNVILSPAIIFVVLLLKVAAIALLAGFIARFGRFRRLLLVEQRGPREKLQFAVFLGAPFMMGVLARLLARYQATDLNLEVTVLAGLLGGTIVGLVVGMMVSLPAVLIGHEILAAKLGEIFRDRLSIPSDWRKFVPFPSENAVTHSP